MHPDDASAHPSRILFLDDDPELRRLVRSSFAARRLDVTVAQEVEEAAALLSCRPFDAFCADLSLDGLGRFEVLDLIRELRATRPDLGIVVLTGCDRPDVHATCRASGADAIVVKRGSLTPLHVAVGEVLKSRGGAREFA